MLLGRVMPASELARAKVNLALHVTGRRADGYHVLDSIVVFAECSDRVTLASAKKTRLSISGPFATGLTAGRDNSTRQALNLFDPQPAVDIHLEKNLPVAAGIGGGSADAAAVLRAYARLRKCPMPAANAILALGADVPVCLDQRAVRMRGIGEQLTSVTLPDLHAVLINPGPGVSTAAVFANLDRYDGAGFGHDLPDFPNAEAAIGWLSSQRNDLQSAACELAPVILDVVSELSQNGAILARMSGSGATCFGLFKDTASAAHAAARIAQAYPNWWVCPTVFRSPAT